MLKSLSSPTEWKICRICPTNFYPHSRPYSRLVLIYSTHSKTHSTHSKTLYISKRILHVVQTYIHFTCHAPNRCLKMCKVNLHRLNVFVQAPSLSGSPVHHPTCSLAMLFSSLATLAILATARDVEDGDTGM